MSARPEPLTKFTLENGVTVSVYPGRLSDLDIVVKYKLGAKGARERTPKHIHWAVDVLLKKQGNLQVTRKLLDYLLAAWGETKPIRDRTERERLSLHYAQSYPAEFATLDQHGYFSVQFLVILAELLMRQEKTNRPDAYMFGRVLESLRDPDEKDLFKVISTAALPRIEGSGSSPRTYLWQV